MNSSGYYLLYCTVSLCWSLERTFVQGTFTLLSLFRPKRCNHVYFYFHSLQLCPHTTISTAQLFKGGGKQCIDCVFAFADVQGCDISTNRHEKGGVEPAVVYINLHISTYIHNGMLPHLKGFFLIFLVILQEAIFLDLYSIYYPVALPCFHDFLELTQVAHLKQKAKLGN